LSISSKMTNDQEHKPGLLIVDDDEGLRTQMKWALIEEYSIFIAEDRKNALDIVKRERPAVMTLDLGLPPNPDGVEEGFETLNNILVDYPETKVIIITGRGEKENALKAIEHGAFDFFYKPVDIDELKIILRRAFHISRLEKENRQLQSRLNERSLEGMIGTCEKIQKVFTMIRKVSTTDAPVLIEGESGTGKELVAGAIHSLSSRKNRPFVVINCGAIPENLLESELFGHEKGAFTGAHIQRKGRIELAEGGTLFLDEIGELTLPLQVKILQFLQKKVIERVGGRKEIEIDARIIAATNKNLQEEMQAGNFREDLYFRLSVVNLFLPPLREREGDIILLAKAFLKRFTKEYNKRLHGFTVKAIEAIERFEWTGNVRELENRVKRAVIMAEGDRVTPDDLDITTIKSKYSQMKLKDAREALDRELIMESLTRNLGNITNASSDLGISRPTLYDLMAKYQINL
jgi:two-component system, NtrC family, response regulator